jgi:putative sporulation protein YtxC
VKGGDDVGYEVSILWSSDLSDMIQLRACLQACMVQLQENGCCFILTEHVKGNRQFFLCATDSRHDRQEKEMRKQLGRALAEYICECQEPAMIRNIIQSEHRFRDPKEVLQIQHVTQRLLEESVWEHAHVIYANRREKLAEQIDRFCKKNGQIAIDGFVRFRLKTYRQALSACVQDAIHEYLLHKEYKEFIQLLRYFISMQTSKIPLLHVIHKGGKNFQIYKADGTLLRLKEMDGAFQEVMEQTFSREDVVVSTLLTIAPEKIILHTVHLEENLICTLMQIFAGRILICDGCTDCGISIDFHQKC